MQAYLGGASLIEAYWKSVARPGEGLFIGEPLTAPFARKMIRFAGDAVTLPAGLIASGRYQVQVADFPVGPYRDSGRALSVSDTARPTSLDALEQTHLRLVRLVGR